MTPFNDPVALAKFRLSPRGNGKRIPYDYTKERAHLIGRYYAQQITGTQRFVISWHDRYDIAHSIEIDYLDAIEWLDKTQGNEPPQAPPEPEPEPARVDKRLKENRRTNPTPPGYMSAVDIANMYGFTSAKVRRDLQLLSDDIRQAHTKKAKGGKWLVKCEYVQVMYNTPDEPKGVAWYGRVNLETWQPSRPVEWLATQDAEATYNSSYATLRHYIYRNRPLLRARGFIKKVGGILYIIEELVDAKWGKKSEKIESE